MQTNTAENVIRLSVIVALYPRFSLLMKLEVFDQNYTPQ